MFNLGFIGIAVSLLPELLSAIGETIQAVEAQFGPGNGEYKKQQVLEALQATYRVADAGLHLPDSVDKAVADGLPHLVELMFRGMSDTEQEAAHELPPTE